MPTPPLQEGTTSTSPQATVTCCCEPPVRSISKRRQYLHLNREPLPAAARLTLVASPGWGHGHASLTGGGMPTPPRATFACHCVTPHNASRRLGHSHASTGNCCLPPRAFRLLHHQKGGTPTPLQTIVACLRAPLLDASLSAAARLPLAASPRGVMPTPPLQDDALSMPVQATVTCPRASPSFPSR